MKNNGFTLIELVVVIVLLGVLAVIATPKFINIEDDAKLANMMAVKGAIQSAESMVALKIQVAPEGLNTNQNTFTLSSGQSIRVRGKLPDGRWNNTFAYLVDLSRTEQITSNNCTDTELQWCVRQRGQSWFNSRGYSSLGTGRGFVIFPPGYNVNQDRCYVYYMNQNSTAIPVTNQASIVDVDFSEC